ncbi:MAG: DUF4440 domain-containing protein [Acidimicrobiia bacterium]
MSLKRQGKSPYWRDELLELEQRLLDPAVRGSPAAVIPLLHTDFLEFGSSGRVYTKEMMVQMMVQETPGMVRIRDFDVKELSDDVALVTYRTLGTKGRETRRSSIWLRRDSGWQIVFHQGTRIHDRPNDG